MDLDLANFKDEKISDAITVGADCTVPFNVANYMEAHKIKTVRLYLRSKLLTTDSDDDLYHSPFDIKEVMPPVDLENVRSTSVLSKIHKMFLRFYSRSHNSITSGTTL